MEEGRRKIIFSRPIVDREFKESIKSETALPKHPAARRGYLLDSEQTFRTHGDSLIVSPFPRTQVSRNAMAQAMTKEAQFRDAVMARPRYYDPIRSFTLIGIPFQMQLEAERKKIRQWCRFYFMTHHLVPTAIEIFARFPLIGFENTCKDEGIRKFYDELFLDENRMDYQNFLVQLGLEYWQIGEIFAFGEWSDELGIWVSEELIDPDLVEVEYFPLLKSRAFKMKIPEHLRKLVQNKNPKQEWEALVNQMPEIIPYINRNEAIPIDGELMKQLKCGGANWETHGVPILLRAFRTLMLEEKLNMSQMAVAERLYLPLLVGKLGSSSYGQDGQYWIPTNEQLMALRDDVELAMSSDFRFMATHWAVDFQNVWGREVVPDMTMDYQQIERKILNIFGISESLISGQSQQPYASTALNADFLNQRLKSYQDELKRHIKDRYRDVAIAQEFYDYEKKGDRYVPIYEEHLVYDPETGETRRENKRKLLYPEPIMRVMDMRDEATQREFLFSLRDNGVPIADSTMLIGVEFDFDEELEKRLDQERKKIVAQQQSWVRLYNELKEAGLPVPGWLKKKIVGIEEGEEVSPEMGEFTPTPLHPVGPSAIEGPAEIPELGGKEPMEGMGPPETEEEGAIIKPLPQNRVRPEESAEQMGTMPKVPASLQYKLRKMANEDTD